jgi:hypothetical protein
MVDIANEYKNDPQFRTVAIGLDTDHFITHNKVGIYLVERAQQCRVRALEELTEIDPYNGRAILEAQYRAKIPDLFLTWLEEAIANGINEEEIIKSEDF